MARILTCADTALLISFDGEPQASDRVLALDAALGGPPPAGVAELVPGLSSLLAVLDGSRPVGAVREAIETVLAGLAGGAAAAPPSGREVELPVRFGGDDGPDLAGLAARVGTDPAGVVALLTATPLRVALVGHLPGLPYLRGLPAALDVPRRERPRTAVPAGSVGVAAGMACVYPARAPGGWHLVGRTEARLVDLDREPPFLLAPGDTVRLVPAAADAAPRPDHRSSAEPPPK